MDRIYQKYLGWINEHGLVGIDSEKNPAKSKQDKLKKMYTVYQKSCTFKSKNILDPCTFTNYIGV